VTASELAFLALGILLGATTGAAFLLVLGSRPGRREILVTVTRDAVPRRSETLSQDAFLTSPAEPARGGPGDRRSLDRPGGNPVPGVPTWQPATPPAQSRAATGDDRPEPQPNRTIVPSPASSVAIAIEPEVDRELDEVRRRTANGSRLERILRGEHRAMVEVVDALAGADNRQRRNWELLLGGLVESMADIAVSESVIDFPMGTAFWDTFTVEQCRRVVASLASMGYRYDGQAGWADSRVPAYRVLTQALADIGMEPRRIRAWPNQSEIATLFTGARPAPEELLAAAGPDYTADDMRALLGDHAAALGDLWDTWEAIKPALLAEDDIAAAEAPSRSEAHLEG
jgi:hypothetical protein